MMGAGMIINRDNWATPPDFREAVINAFGWPSIDVCADSANAFAAGGAYVSERQNGLERDWCFNGRSGFGWCNPPGSQVAQWTAKALEESRARHRSLVLVQCGIESGWYEAVRPYCETIFLTPRVQFVPPPGVAKSSNARNYMLLVFDPWMVNIPGDRYRHWKWKRALMAETARDSGL